MVSKNIFRCLSEKKKSPTKVKSDHTAGLGNVDEGKLAEKAHVTSSRIESHVRVVFKVVIPVHHRHPPPLPRPRYGRSQPPLSQRLFFMRKRLHLLSSPCTVASSGGRILAPDPARNRREHPLPSRVESPEHHRGSCQLVILPLLCGAQGPAEAAVRRARRAPRRPPTAPTCGR